MDEKKDFPKIKYTGRPQVQCENCGEQIQQGEWEWDDEEHEPTCPCCRQFLNLPEGW